MYFFSREIGKSGGISNIKMSRVIEMTRMKVTLEIHTMMEFIL